MNQTLCYTVKKALWTIPILVGITFLALGPGLVVQGDPVANRASADPNYIPTKEGIQEPRTGMGLDDPILVQYGRWIRDTAHDDSGESYIGDKPVLDEILRLLLNTPPLSGVTLLVITVVGPAGGLLLTLFWDKFIDLFGRALLVFLISIPGFYPAYFMIWLFAQRLCILPTSGAETLSCFLIPYLAISAGSACTVIRLLRSSVLRELSKNYILIVQTKDLRKGQLISRHVLRNSLVPSTVYIANTFGGLLGGSMVTESVFSIPRIGSYALTTTNNRNYIAIQGYVLFIGVVFALVCLLADLIYVWLNP